MLVTVFAERLVKGHPIVFKSQNELVIRNAVNDAVVPRVGFEIGDANVRFRDATGCVGMIRRLVAWNNKRGHKS